MELSNFLKSEHGRIILMIIILLVSVFAGWLIKKAMYFIYRKSSAKRKVEPGGLLLITSFIRLTILVIGVSYAISLEPGIKSVTTSLLASAGIATAIVGFAAKDVLANFVSGAVIIVFRPFTVTHWIKVGNIHEGKVEEIKMLYTVIRDFTNRRLIIPNSKILSTDVINSSYRDEHVAQIIEFEISYESDIEKAKKIISEVAEASPLCIDRRKKEQKEKNEPIVQVGLLKLGSYSMTLAAFVWADSPADAHIIKWALNEEVRKRFNEKGIKFPYPNLIVREEPSKKPETK